jgi:mono/diheme cytochrome c family protein
MKLKIIAAIIFVFTALIVSCQSEEAVEYNRYFTAGSLTYQNHCQNCHGAKGEGLVGLIPPLADTAFIKANKTSLACAVKYGLRGKVTVAGRQFQEKMPPSNLPDIEIAYALTYIGNSFGNKLGIIDVEQVGVDLAKCK